MNWLETTAQISQIAAVVSVIFAAYSIRANTKLTYRQWNVDTFTTYSERHKSAIEAFPDNTFYNRLDPEKLPPRSPELSKAVLNYLFVICDVHYLAYHRYLEESIWQAWRADLTRTLRCPLITREWTDLKPQFEYFGPFAQFVEEIQNKGETETKEKES